MIKSIKKAISVALVLFLSNMPEIAYAACASPAANEGAREYFTATGTYAYCDGTNWLYYSTSNGAACTVEGQWDYDTVTDKYQYCGMTGSGGGSGITGVAAGYSTTCALKSDGTAWCWGSNYTGALGNNTTANSSVPTGVSSQTWLSLGANMAGMIFDDGSGISTFHNSMNCAIDDADETLWCWEGICNESACPTSSTPVQFDTDTWQSITASDYERDLLGGNNDPHGFVCGIKTDGTGWCWGNDDFEQLGNGGNVMFPGGFYMTAPAQISTNDVSTWKMLSAAGGFEDVNSFACGIAGNDTLWCWGGDLYGQLGNGGTTGTEIIPTAVDVSGGIPDTWKSVAVNGTYGGFKVGCAIAMNDTLWCWGIDAYGSLGNGGTTGTQTSPSAVDTSGSIPDTWKKVDTSGITTCAIGIDDTLWCWGDDGFGQIGNGAVTTAQQTSPVAADITGSIPDTWKDISLGNYHACAVGNDDTLWCWGADFFDQLGNGATTTNQTSPVQVSGGGTWMSGGSSSSLVWKSINCDGISPCTNLGACANEAQMEYIPGSDIYRVCTGAALNNMKITCGTAAFTAFTDLTAQAPPASVKTSEIRQVTGLTCAGTISISGASSPEYRTCSDAACSTVVQNWGNTAGTISNNHYVQIRQTSSLGATVTATLDVEGTTDAWTVESTCGTPSFGTFTNLTAQTPPAATKTSDILQVTGLSCATAISISGTGTPQYRICSDAACSSEVQTWGSAAATISNNQYMQLRLTSIASGGSVRSATIDVSGVAGLWSVTNATYKLAFVTSSTHTGSMGGIAGADFICATRATSASLTGTFKAWIAVAAATDPESTFTTSISDYRMPNGTVIANGWTDLVDNTLDSALNVYQDGSAAAGATQVWTNVQADATREGPNNSDCSDWTATGGNGNIGLRTSATATWTNDATLSCASSARLYCFEQ